MESLPKMSIFQLQDLSFSYVVFILAFGITTITSSVIFYRLFLSPLANIPGPKLAAATGAVEVWYDVWKGGQYIFKIEEWHERYGPIVRITPWQVHIRDPDFFDELYSMKQPRHNKLEYLSHRFNSPTSTTDLFDAAEHTRRRAVLAPLFARPRAYEFADYLQSRVDTLCQTLRQNYAGKGKVVELSKMWSAFTADSVLWYTTAMSYDICSEPSFESPFTQAFWNVVFSMNFVTHFRTAAKLINSLPRPALERLSADMGLILKLYDDIRSQIRHVVAGEQDGRKSVSHQTVFHELLSSLGKDAAAFKAMEDDGVTITLAGVHTTQTVLSLICFWLLELPDVGSRLRKELEAAIPDPEKVPRLQELERLPYLTAIIQEGFRMSYGVSGRLARYNPHIAVQYKGYTLPPGVEFSMTPAMQLRNSEVFPDPHTFNPDRWMNDPVSPTGRPLTKYLVHFGKGPRMCLGMHLAQAELYIGLATMFRRMEFKLFESGRECVDLGADYFVTVPKDVRGVRVTVEG